MQSIWSESVKNNIQPHHPELTGNIKADVLIIGGGMAGILAAHRLTRAGAACVLAEAKRIGDGVTKNTTAKITAQHGLIYADIVKRLGIAQARLYFEANTRAVAAFRKLSEATPCDFEEKTAYVYSTNNRQRLEREADAYHKMGIKALFQEAPPLPLKTAGALGMPQQAQFNPLKLLSSLAAELKIYENTFVKAVDGNTAITEKGRIKAKNIILATHFPLVNIPGLYFMKLYQHRSYVIALDGAPLFEGMYVDDRPNGHSFRTYQNLLLVGGVDHRTGKHGGGFEELRRLAVNAWPSAAITHSWAAQDCMSLDGIPYIGRHRASSQNIFVATGFNKWGMTSSATAAELLCDLILNGKSDLEKLFSPQRFMMGRQLAANVLSSAAGLLSVGGPRCAHMGCKLHWNKAEQTWDCSCHGSRFEKFGSVADNPAKKGIRP